MTGCYDATGSVVSGGEQPGTRRLHNWMMSVFGGGSFGIYNPNSRAGGGLSLHAEGRGMDHAVELTEVGLERGNRIFHWAIDNADAIGLQEVQFNGRIWTCRRSSEGIRVDTSTQAGQHRDHVHIGQCWNGALGRTSWYSNPDTYLPGTQTPQTPPEVDMPLIFQPNRASGTQPGFAYLDIPAKQILLYNKASLANDAQAGPPFEFVRVFNLKAQPWFRYDVRGWAEWIDKSQVWPASGNYSRGVIVFNTAGEAYRLPWS